MVGIGEWGGRARANIKNEAVGGGVGLGTQVHPW